MNGVRYDLEERTSLFAEAVVEFLVGVQETAVTRPLISQAVRAATSVGANYGEADDAVSKRDFAYKIAICRKEARETKYWLRMLVKADPRISEEARPLWQEAKELHLILSKIWHSSRKA